MMPDPDLEIRGRGSSRPLDKGGRTISKKNIGLSGLSLV